MKPATNQCCPKVLNQQDPSTAIYIISTL